MKIAGSASRQLKGKTMQKITQAEFDALPVIDGYRQCPGFRDYSGIKNFGERCSFGQGCRFGERCRFGEGCSFSQWCSFGERCRFGEVCSFGQGCRFGERCRFGEVCSFGQGCIFGEKCRFGEGCSFSQWCSFGGAEFLNPRIIMLTSVGDSWSIVIWRGADGIDRFQIGCRFDTEENCLAAIAEKYGSESLYHGAIHLLKRIADKECSGNHL